MPSKKCQTSIVFSNLCIYKREIELQRQRENMLKSLIIEAII